MRPHDVVEILLRHVEEGRRAVHAGIVDQNVEGGTFGQRSSDTVGIAQVERQRLGHAARRAHLISRRFQFVGAARGERDLRAVAGERERGGEPDAPSRAGDENAPAVEPEIRGEVPSC